MNGIIEVLTESKDPADYFKKLRKRDPELDAFVRGTNCPPTNSYLLMVNVMGVELFAIIFSRTLLMIVGPLFLLLLFVFAVNFLCRRKAGFS